MQAVKPDSNITKYCRALTDLWEQYPGILNGEVMTHFLVDGKRVLSYEVFQGVPEILSTLEYLVHKYTVKAEDVVLTCEKIENQEARQEHRRKQFFTVIPITW